MNQQDDAAPDVAAFRNAINENGRSLAGRLPMLGHATWLCTRSPAHRLLFVQDFDWRVLPPMLFDQYKLYFDGASEGLPVAFVSWALLNEAAEQRFVDTQRLSPGDWRSGQRLWLVDFVTPFGGTRRILSDLRHGVHRGQTVNLLYPDANAIPRPTTLDALLQAAENRAGTDDAASDSTPTCH